MKLITGNLISLVFITVALYLSKIAGTFPFLIRFPVLFLCWFVMLYFTHCLSHYIVGRLLGVKFSHYFLSKSMLARANIPVISKAFSAKVFLTLKIKERSSNKRMFAMFLAGPLASMFCPLSVVLIAYTYDKFSATVLLAITLGNILFSGYYSYKHGCIRKALRVLKGLSWIEKS